jgi:hypothetical protein
METTIGDDEAITLNSQRGLSAQNSMPSASRQAGTVEIQKQARHLETKLANPSSTARFQKPPLFFCIPMMWKHAVLTRRTHVPIPKMTIFTTTQ